MSNEAERIFLQAIQRYNGGDAQAGGVLLGRAQGRLKQLAVSFPDPIADRNGEPADKAIVQAALTRLTEVLEQSRPASAVEYLGLAAETIRQILANSANKRLSENRSRSKAGTQTQAPPSFPVMSKTFSGEPHTELMSQLHTRANELPEMERDVFQLQHYVGLSHHETAGLLGLDAKIVRHRWILATERLADDLFGIVLQT